MNNGISRAPMLRRIDDKIMPIGDSNFVNRKGNLLESILVVDAGVTPLQGLFTSVEKDTIVVDSGASFTPDLVGKLVYRLSATANSDTGTVTRAPDLGIASTDNYYSEIIEVVSPTKLRLANQIFYSGTSLYYAIDNNTGAITDYVDGFITTDTASKIIDANANFDASLVGKYVCTHEGNAFFRQKISTVDSTTQLTLEQDIPTTVGKYYVIIVEDDAFRFTQSAISKYQRQMDIEWMMTIVMKDGVYREMCSLSCYSTKAMGAKWVPGLSIIGDNQVASAVIFDGSFATASTTQRLYYAFRVVGVLRFLVFGVSFRYYWGSMFEGYGGAILFLEVGTMTSMRNVATGATYVSINGLKLDTITQGIMSPGYGGGILRLWGSTEFATAIYAFGDYSSGIGTLVLDSYTATGAGSFSHAGKSKYPVFLASPSGTAPPYITDAAAASGFWQGYFATTATKTAATAAAGAATLPANPEGFVIIYVGGVQKKIPYYTA